MLFRSLLLSGVNRLGGGFLRTIRLGLVKEESDTLTAMGIGGGGRCTSGCTWDCNGCVVSGCEDGSCWGLFVRVVFCCLDRFGKAGVNLLGGGFLLSDVERCRCFGMTFSLGAAIEPFNCCLMA